MRTRGTIGLGLVWILQILLAVLFMVIGAGKFGDPSWARKFAAWGYPDGFYLVIGVLEAIGGIMLAVPRLTSYGAALVGTIMIGASLTHLLHGETARAGVPLVYLLLVAVAGALRWKSAIRPAARRAPQLERI